MAAAPPKGLRRASTRSVRTWKGALGSLGSGRGRASLRAGARGAATTREEDGRSERVGLGAGAGAGVFFGSSSLRGSGVGSGGGRDSSATSCGVPPVQTLTQVSHLHRVMPFIEPWLIEETSGIHSLPHWWHLQ